MEMGMRMEMEMDEWVNGSGVRLIEWRLGFGMGKFNDGNSYKDGVTQLRNTTSPTTTSTSSSSSSSSSIHPLSLQQELCILSILRRRISFLFSPVPPFSPPQSTKQPFPSIPSQWQVEFQFPLHPSRRGSFVEKLSSFHFPSSSLYFSFGDSLTVYSMFSTSISKQFSISPSSNLPVFKSFTLVAVIFSSLLSPPKS